ncbi:hypothetical protein POVCU2_0034430 [Plasmodium ovale curtisi]|uniref:Uncharacterized protein n=1 Tax=Plasmodium ovale curtisi TaxID=864141 RepID=A0A1A8WV84_PLAOA|nr:hypothetical protein POVCU2_0034430 [Plasmodium ovale curtisi]SBS96250.1 hypothetical protein POVCU1_031600 [Plasmodium ovale curtisi]
MLERSLFITSIFEAKVGKGNQHIRFKNENPKHDCKDAGNALNGSTNSAVFLSSDTPLDTRYMSIGINKTRTKLELRDRIKVTAVNKVDSANHNSRKRQHLVNYSAFRRCSK